MRHPYFHKAVQEAFEGLIQPTEQVPYILYMQVDPSSIDVNIHPTKTEIKFENEQAIWQILMAAVKEALGRFNAVPIIDFDVDGRPKNIPVYNPSFPKDKYASPPKVNIDHTYNPFRNTDSQHKDVPIDWQQLYPVPDPSKEDGVSNPQESTALFDDQLNLSDIERSAHIISIVVST